MIPQRIQRKSAKGWKKPGGAVYVGGGSKWGNLHIVRRDGGFMWVEGGGHVVCSTDREGNLRERRQEAVDLYRRNWIPLVDLTDLRDDLAGKNLMCWCPLSQPCHADVLLELANGDRLPVGTPVLFWPGARAGEGRLAVTRTPIFKMGDGTEVVSVEGYPGGIALTHIEPTENETTR